MNKNTTGHVQLLILEFLDSTRPLGAAESLLRSALTRAQISHADLRRELVYLQEHGLVEISDRTRPNWHAKLKPGVILDCGCQRTLH